MLRIKVENNYDEIISLLEANHHTCLIGKNVKNPTDIVVNDNHQYYIIGQKLSPITTMKPINLKRLKKRLNPQQRNNAIPVTITEFHLDFRSIGECAIWLKNNEYGDTISNIKGKLIYAIKAKRKAFGLTILPQSDSQSLNKELAIRIIGVQLVIEFPDYT